MIGRIYEFVIDCPEPVKLAEFYRALTGLEELDSDPSWVTLGSDGEARVAFQRVADYRAPRWPDPQYPQQMHLDLYVADLDAAESQVLALGATLIGGEGSANCRTYADPVGHPFCLCAEG